MKQFATVQNSNHPDVPNGTTVWIVRRFAGGYEVRVTSNFVDAGDLYKSKKEKRIIWLQRNQLKFTS